MDHPYDAPTPQMTTDQPPPEPDGAGPFQVRPGRAHRLCP
jgi:hypothetical protein